MIVRLAEEEKTPKQVFKVDKEFKTKTTITKRTAAIGEAFGIGVDEEKTFPIFKDFIFEIKPGDVVLITGDSGSGKSTLLAEVCNQISNSQEDFQNAKIVSNDSISINEDETIIESVGRDTGEAIGILSMAGLNEAFLMLRKFKELSDGQKYRYRIAKMIDSEQDVWAFDEFASILDRITAKCVAYTIQKTARKTGKTLIVATTHEDLVNDLKPDIWIQKKFGESVSVSRYSKTFFPKECSLLEDAIIQPCKLEDLESLEKFHYRGKVRAIVKHCFKATIHGELAAGVVFVSPHLSLRGRNIAFPEFRGKQTRELGKKINAEILRISRVIVSPKFRSISLGAKIIRETMPLCSKRIIEVLAVMAKYNPVFESAGMTSVPVKDDEKCERDLKQLESLGFRRELLPSRNHTESIVNKLSESQLEIAKRFVLKYCAVRKRRGMALIPRIERLDRSAIIEALRLHSSRPLYLYWKNPELTEKEIPPTSIHGL